MATNRLPLQFIKGNGTDQRTDSHWDLNAGEQSACAHLNACENTAMNDHFAYTFGDSAARCRLNWLSSLQSKIAFNQQGYSVFQDGYDFHRLGGKPP